MIFFGISKNQCKPNADAIATSYRNFMENELKQQMINFLAKEN
jgi:hypothetical protein